MRRFLFAFMGIGPLLYRLACLPPVRDRLMRLSKNSPLILKQKFKVELASCPLEPAGSRFHHDADQTVSF